jgi:hypothetical protein
MPAQIIEIRDMLQARVDTWDKSIWEKVASTPLQIADSAIDIAVKVMAQSTIKMADAYLEELKARSL